MAILVSVSIIHGQDKPTLAVLEFEGIGISGFEARVLTNRLATFLVQTGRYSVLERNEITQILSEQDFQSAGCTTDECAVEIGQLLNAQFMLMGSYGKLGSTFTIDMRIIDVESGSIINTASYDVKGEIDLILSEGLPAAIEALLGEKKLATPTVQSIFKEEEIPAEPTKAKAIIGGNETRPTPPVEVTKIFDAGNKAAASQPERPALGADQYMAMASTSYSSFASQSNGVSSEAVKNWIDISIQLGKLVYASDKPLGILPFNHRFSNVMISYDGGGQIRIFRLGGRFVTEDGIDIGGSMRRLSSSDPESDYASSSIRLDAGKYLGSALVAVSTYWSSTTSEYSESSSSNYSAKASYFIHDYHSIWISTSLSNSTSGDYTVSGSLISAGTSYLALDRLLFGTGLSSANRQINYKSDVSYSSNSQDTNLYFNLAYYLNRKSSVGLSYSMVRVTYENADDVSGNNGMTINYNRYFGQLAMVGISYAKSTSINPLSDYTDGGLVINMAYLF